MADILVVLIRVVFQFFWWAILIRVLLSWLPMAGIRIDPYNPIIQFLFQVTDPILEPLRRYTTIGMIDLSPIVALIGLGFIEGILISLLVGG
jgi:YggT family protein